MVRNIILFILATFILPLSMKANDDKFAKVRELSKELEKLQEQVESIKASIKQEEDKCNELVRSWYDTCNNYLKKNNFKEEELQYLLDNTFRELDGEELFEEIKKALEAKKNGVEYIYQTIPVPRMYTSSTRQFSPRLKDEPKKQDGKKKDKHRKKPEGGLSDNPAKDNTPKQDNPEVKTGQPKGTNTDKGENGEDTPDPTAKKDGKRKDDKTTPEVPPVDQDQKKYDSDKTGKKYDKTELEDGVSKEGIKKNVSSI